MQSMTAVEFAVPPIAAGPAGDSKSAVATMDSAMGSGSLQEGLDPELAALVGMWAAIFQQQILPQSEATAGKALDQNGAVDTGAADTVRLDSKSQWEASGVRDLNQGSVSTLSDLLARLGTSLPPLSLPAASLPSATNSAAVNLNPADLNPPTATAQTSPASGTSLEPQSGIPDSSIPLLLAAEAKGLQPTTDTNSRSLPSALDETARSSAAEGYPEEALLEGELSQSANESVIPSPDPNSDALNLTTPSLFQPDATSHKALTASPGIEQKAVSAGRPAASRRLSAPGSLASTHLETGPELLEAGPKLTTELSMRKKLNDPAQFYLDRNPETSLETAPHSQLWGSGDNLRLDPATSAGLPPVEWDSRNLASLSAESVAPTSANLSALPDAPLAGDPAIETLAAASNQPAPREIGPQPELSARQDAPPAESAPGLESSPLQATPMELKRTELPAQGIPSKAPQPSAAPRRAALEVPAPTPASSKEARTISIRIPLTDSSRSPGNPVRHLDLVFSQKSNDLNLQFLSPSPEIQRNIEESIPSLMDRLRSENWAQTAPDSTLVAQAAESGAESRRRVESFVSTSATFENYREAIASPQASSQGFGFDDAPQQRKGDPQQQPQPRNPKREENWRDELDQLLES